MKRIEIPIIDRKEDIVSVDTTSNSSIFSLYNHIPLQEIYKKYKRNQEFTRDDLISLYDIYNVNQTSYLCAGLYQKLFFMSLEITNSRNYFNDMAEIFDCSPEQVALNYINLHKDPNRYVVLMGELGEDVFNTKYENLKYINGKCNFSNKLEIEGIFPNLLSISGNANFNSLKNSYGLENLKSIGGNACFNELIDASDLCNLEIIGGQAYFNNLEDSKGLDKIKYFCNHIYFNKLTNASHLTNLEYIFGDTYFPSLKDIKGLEKVKDIKGILNFDSLNKNDYELIKKRIRK